MGGAFMEGLLDKWLAPLLPVTFPVFLDPALERRPGACCMGKQAVNISIAQSGVVQCGEVP